ncbi:hypothetical protein [Rhodobacter sp. 24-YEA-8]|uniref:hypothetical protein n=1 Tax=Rhodobacter sp. 24-YEA-8 TaxID=1884310 RepID=UPI00089B4D37|nr:hypothetical protein [Rhodobacter sp. 24-YEA-8]SEC14291.1 hypothetical protein SAMN05519105_2031 [Rhodobacter sp. 24-YEA-8]
MSISDHIIPDGPARIAGADRIATVFCDDIEAWDALAALTAAETTPGGDWAMGNSGLEDISRAASEIQAAHVFFIPVGAASCRVYFKNPRKLAAFMQALEKAGGHRVPYSDIPNPIYIPAAAARDMAARL